MGEQRESRLERAFPICKDHTDSNWNQPELDEESCLLCRLFYLEAQESLLEEWQQRALKAEETIKEIERPLDAQMARLNATVARLNGENERLRESAARMPVTSAHVYKDACGDERVAIRYADGTEEDKPRPDSATDGEPPAGAAPDQWRAMVYAPLDGTEIELLIRHFTYWTALKVNGREEAERLWQGVCRGRWIDHNGGGWTWHGLAGSQIGWRPLPREDGHG